MTRARSLTALEAALSAASLTVGGVAVAARPTPGSAAVLAVSAAAASVVFALAVLVARHAPHNRVAPALGSIALLVAFMPATDLYGIAAADGLLPLSRYVVAFGQGSWMLWYLPFAALLLVFPDGRLPGPRWWMVPAGFAVVLVLFNIATAFAQGPYMEPFEAMDHPVPSHRLALGAAIALLPAFLGLLVASVAAVVVRARRATGREREQLHWLLLASTSLPLTLLLCWFSYLVLGTADLVLVGFAVMLLAFPTAAALAVVRHDLYDVDQALVTTSVYGLIGAGLLLVFTVVSAGVGLVAGSVSTPLAIVATAGCGVLLGGSRAWLTRRVGALLHPVRDRVRAALADLRARIRAGEAVPEQVEPVLREALGDPGLRVGHLAPDHVSFVDRDGRPVEPRDDAQPVLVAGSTVGVLSPGRPQARWLLKEVAAEAAMLVENARLRLELAHALREVEASRERLVLASDEERKRLERDLHDGTQQRLVSLGMSLRLAQRHLDDETVDLDQVIEGAVAELGTAVSELRQIAHGLRPSSLDDGLPAALTNLVRGVPVRVDLDVCATRLPDHVSTTAYFVASEALTNAVKHSGAEAVGLSVVADHGELRVEVSDDGRGGAAIRPGSGLAGLRDRVHAVGGRLDVISAPGRGTLVEAVLPCGS